MSPTKTTRMEVLPPEVAAALPAIRDEWLAIGLATGAGNRATAEMGVRATYRESGLPEPLAVVWLGSPYAGAIGRAYLSILLRTMAEKGVRAQVGDQVWAQVRDQVREQVGAQVGAQVGEQVWEQVGAQVWAQVVAQVEDQVWDQVMAQVGAQVRDQVGVQVMAQVRDQVRAQVGAQVGAQVWDQVRDQVVAQVGAQVRDQVRDQVGDQVWAELDIDLTGYVYWGQHDANWLGFFDTFARAGIAACSRLDGMKAIARNAGWWWPLAGGCVITERPARLARDTEGRLHCADAMCIAYPDGWGFYAWHGVRVPEQVIVSPETLTPTQILGEPNAEVRRVMMERYGMARLLRDARAERVDASDYGTLYRLPVANDEPLVMVEVENATPEPDGTQKKYTLRVPPTIATAHEAVAWTFGMTPREYAVAEAS